MSNRRRLRRPQPTSFVARHRDQAEQHGGMRPRWNGEPCDAVKVRLLVEAPPAGQFPNWWAQHLIGTERAAVRVTYHGQVFYLDDEDGSGWAKVTEGRGSPRWPHKELLGAEVLRDADASGPRAVGRV